MYNFDLTKSSSTLGSGDAFIEKVIKPIIADRVNSVSGGGESGSFAAVTNKNYMQKMLSLVARIPSKNDEAAYDREINKFAKRLISGAEEASIPSELARIMQPLKMEIATAKSLPATSEAAAHVKSVRMASAENALMHIVKSELIATLSACHRANPLGLLTGAESGYSLATMRPFQLLETAIQYKNTVKVVYNKLIETQVFTDRINVQYLRQKWLISYVDENGKEVRTNIVDHYNSLEQTRKLRMAMMAKKVVTIPTSGTGNGYEDGNFNLITMGIYKAGENLAPEARVTGVTLKDGQKIEITSPNMNSAPDAHIINDGKISIVFAWKDAQGKAHQGSIQGSIQFNDFSGIILATKDVESVDLEFSLSNEMYARAYKMDTTVEKENFQINYTERINFTYNPRVNQIFNASLGSDVMSQLIAKGSETVTHSKEVATFDIFTDTCNTLKKALASVGDAIEGKQILYAEEEIEASYYQGVSMNDTMKTKVTNGLNRLYHRFSARTNSNSDIGFGVLMAPELTAYLTAVTPIIAKESMDTTVPGTFAGSPVASSVYSFSLDSTGMGGLRGIAVKSDKLNGYDITMIPQILDENMKNFVLAEQPVLIYSNNEIRNPENLAAPNIHLEAPFTPWVITPSICKATITNLGKSEIIPVKVLEGLGGVEIAK